MICKNCQSELDESFDYCPHCGQDTHIKRLNWKSLSDNIAKGWFGSDRGVFFTLGALFSRPGTMMKEYVEGKRIQYFGPFQMLFLLAALYYFLHFFFGFESETLLDNGEIHKIDEEIIQITPFVRQLITFISNNLTLLWLLSLPFLTWMFRLVLGHHFRKTYNFVESNFMITYCISQLMVFNILELILDFFFGAAVNLTGWIYFAFIILFTWNLKQIVGGSWMHNFWRSVGIFFFTMILIIISLFIIIIILGLSIESVNINY
ncbi:MAG: DUF3667 domain-containing protein [Bacteroidales bacterium]|nr:DUF3667 domain-containing protein [Bacteroidales bacterium]